jgi:hypothetical protein
MLKPTILFITIVAVISALWAFFREGPGKLLPLQISKPYFHLSANVFEAPQVVYTYSLPKAGSPPLQIILADSPKYKPLVAWMKANVGPQLAQVGIEPKVVQNDTGKCFLSCYSKKSQVFETTDDPVTCYIKSSKDFETPNSGCFMRIPITCETLNCSQEELDVKLHALFAILK